uniref:Uncharacterized protein n=2 Tax=Lotharella globosa TaxID=91324 RepID=A0A7S4DVP9_9EUKA
MSSLFFLKYRQITMRTSVIVFSAVVNCALLASICYLAFGGAAVEQPQLSAAMVAKTRMANMVVNGANAVAMKGMKAVDYMHKNAAPTDGKFVNTIKESNPALYKNLVRKRDAKTQTKRKTHNISSSRSIFSHCLLLHGNNERETSKETLDSLALTTSCLILVPLRLSLRFLVRFSLCFLFSS